MKLNEKLKEDHQNRQALDLEKQHKKGYEKQPVKKGEFAIHDDDQDCGERSY